MFQLFAANLWDYGKEHSVSNCVGRSIGHNHMFMYSTAWWLTSLCVKPC